MNTKQLTEKNNRQDLYFVTPENHIIFIPQQWMTDFNEYPNEAYGYIGQEGINSWETKENKEWLTSEVNGWTNMDDLLRMREVNEDEARKIDPPLFRLLDAIDSGEAK